MRLCLVLLFFLHAVTATVFLPDTVSRIHFLAPPEDVVVTVVVITDATLSSPTITASQNGKEKDSLIVVDQTSDSAGVMASVRIPKAGAPGTTGSRSKSRSGTTATTGQRVVSHRGTTGGEEDTDSSFAQSLPIHRGVFILLLAILCLVARPSRLGGALFVACVILLSVTFAQAKSNDDQEIRIVVRLPLGVSVQEFGLPEEFNLDEATLLHLVRSFPPPPPPPLSQSASAVTSVVATTPSKSVSLSRTPSTSPSSSVSESTSPSISPSSSSAPALPSSSVSESTSPSISPSSSSAPALPGPCGSFSIAPGCYGYLAGDIDNWGYCPDPLACVFFNNQNGTVDGQAFDWVPTGSITLSWQYTFPVLGTIQSATVTVRECFSDSTASTISFDGSTPVTFAVAPFPGCSPDGALRVHDVPVALLADGTLNVDVALNGDAIGLDYAALSICY